MTGKQYAKKKENTYYLVSKKKTDNKEIRAILLVNKMVTRRSVCFVCTSRKSTFLKPTKPIKSKKIVFENCKNKCELIGQAVKNILIMYVQKIQS